MSDKLMAVYNRAEITPVRGQGVWLYTASGDAYLDCVAGIATNGLGHAHPKLVAALTRQAQRLWHVSNLFPVEGQVELADKLCGATFADVCFFTNSGSEAVECALKTARRFHAVAGDEERIDVIGFGGSFHGRTYAAINAAGNPSYVEGFGPRLPGYVQLSIDDADGLAEAVACPTTAAVIVEPVQGEGGARALSGEWLQRLRRLCDDNGVLLIYDEVQSGMGRTGRLFAHQWFEDAAPDIMTTAKALGGGFPVGACLATKRAASGMTAGVHGSTFGGNPLAMAVANAAFDEIASTALMDSAWASANRLRSGMEEIARRYPDLVVDVRGKGLLIGVKLVTNNRDFMAAARGHGLLVAGGGENCVRLLPPLTITMNEVDQALNLFDATCRSVRLAQAA